MNARRNIKLQSMCRAYLKRLRYMVNKHGLSSVVDDIIKRNRRGECVATEHEVELLSRLCDDERVTRADIPKLLGVSYRECERLNLFSRIKKLRHVGVYSKISALLNNIK